MNNKNNKYIIPIISICLILLVILLVINKKDNKNTTNQLINEEQNIKNDQNIIAEIKNQINSTADTNIYQVEDEYDGRHTIQIKPNIQYNTVLAGILKGSIPADNEINTILKNEPNKTGIWISNKSQTKFLNILKNNDLGNFDINEDGYLYQKQEKDTEKSKKLDNIIKGDKLFIIDISGTCYTRDDLSGEIIEYPFEKMDPKQVLDIYQNDKNIILEITTNTKGKLSDEEILDTIILNIEI